MRRTTWEYVAYYNYYWSVSMTSTITMRQKSRLIYSVQKEKRVKNKRQTKVFPFSYTLFQIPLSNIHSLFLMYKHMYVIIHRAWEGKKIQKQVCSSASSKNYFSKNLVRTPIHKMFFTLWGYIHFVWSECIIMLLLKSNSTWFYEEF